MNRRFSFYGASAISVFVVTCVFSACSSSSKKAEEHSPERGTAAASASAELPVTTNFIDDINGDNLLNRAEAKYDKLDKVAAGIRLKKIFKYARATSIEFFRELRVKAPIFVSQGNGGIPNVYVVTKYEDVAEVLSDENSPIFSVKTYKEIMDATVGSPYMLGRDGKEFPRAEKPVMRHMLPKNDLDRVREIIRALTLKAIKEGSKNGKLDVVASVSRNVPIGMNGEYFGFPGPSVEKMAEWSRATQHAFFHNPFKDQKVNQASVKAGQEMREHISKVLVPSRMTELKNGRPAYDPVSRMLEAAEAHSKYGLPADRIVANTIGLLVGSVETTSAAIVQAYNYLMEHPELMKEAIAAAKAGDQKLFDAYVWEALRFDPVNPWVGRYATQDYVLGKGKPWETKILKGSLVLASTESAMHDPDYFPESHKFSTRRDPSLYMHLGYATHRCLGDDVSLVMVPETVKHLLLLPNVEKVEPRKGKDFAREPFPEKYVVRYAQKKDDRPVLVRWDNNARTFMKYVGLGDFILEKIMNMEKRKEAVDTIKKIVSGKGEVKEKAMDDLPALIMNGMKGANQDELVKLCMEKNPKSVEVFADAKDRETYCRVRLDFRGCYFTHVLFGGKSGQHAFNHCAYNRGHLTRDEIADFKNKLGHLEQFSFLKYE